MIWSLVEVPKLCTIILNKSGRDRQINILKLFIQTWKFGAQITLWILTQLHIITDAEYGL